MLPSCRAADSEDGSAVAPCVEPNALNRAANVTVMPSDASAPSTPKRAIQTAFGLTVSVSSGLGASLKAEDGSRTPKIVSQNSSPRPTLRASNRLSGIGRAATSTMTRVNAAAPGGAGPIRFGDETTNMPTASISARVSVDEAPPSRSIDSENSTNAAGKTTNSQSGDTQGNQAISAPSQKTPSGTRRNGSRRTLQRQDLRTRSSQLLILPPNLPHPSSPVDAQVATAPLSASQAPFCAGCSIATSTAQPNIRGGTHRTRSPTITSERTPSPAAVVQLPCAPFSATLPMHSDSRLLSPTTASAVGRVPMASPFSRKFSRDSLIRQQYRSMELCFVCGAPYTGVVDQAQVRRILQRARQIHFSANADVAPHFTFRRAGDEIATPDGGSKERIAPSAASPTFIAPSPGGVNGAATPESIASTALAAFSNHAARLRSTSFRRAKRASHRPTPSSFWTSFERYTDYNYSRSLSRDCSMSYSGSLYGNKKWRDNIIMAITEEKCNGDVRFGDGHERSRANSAAAGGSCTSLYRDTLSAAPTVLDVAGGGFGTGGGGGLAANATGGSAAAEKAAAAAAGGGSNGPTAHFCPSVEGGAPSRKSTLNRQIRRRQSGYGISITSDSTAKMRCKMRKMYFLKRNKVCDFSLLLGLVGLILVVIDSELTALDIIYKSDGASWALRGACVASTALLVWTLIDYHRIEVKIALIDSGADDWRVALTTERLIKLSIEIAMADHPLTVLVVFTVSYWICMSWMFTQCERYNNKYTTEHYYMNSLWFIMVTFMSIGYGDVVPNSYCGRLLSITTGIVGAGVSSALIAVISRKLELSRAEKHVNNFMADSKLTKQRKNAAASVLQHTWFIHKYQRSASKGDELRLRQHQRKFLSAINEFRQIKWDQRKLQERGNSLLDVGKLHNEMHETLWEMYRTQDQFIAQIDMLTQRIVDLQAAVLGGQIVTQNAATLIPQQQQTYFVNSNNNHVGGNFGATPNSTTLGNAIVVDGTPTLQTHLLVPQQLQQQQQQQQSTPSQHLPTEQQKGKQTLNSQQLLSVVVVPDNNKKDVNVNENNSYINNTQPQNTVNDLQQQQPQFGANLTFDTKPITLITRRRRNIPSAAIGCRSADFAASLSRALSTVAAAEKEAEPNHCRYSNVTHLNAMGSADSGTNCVNVITTPAGTLCRQSATLQSGSPQSTLASASRTPIHSPPGDDDGDDEDGRMPLCPGSEPNSARKVQCRNEGDSKRANENDGSISNMTSASTESDDCCESVSAPLITRATSFKLTRQ